MTKTFAVALFIAISSFVVASQTQSRADLLKDVETKRAEVETKRAELVQLERKFLAPSAEDSSTYAEFLTQPDTGLIRLLPRESFDSEVYQNKPLLMVRGGGAYYSFTRQTHEYGLGTQIGLERDSLSASFAGADLGILARLGDVPLNSLSFENPAVRFLAAYEPASEEPQARSEYYRFSTGVKVQDVLYKTYQPAIVNSTYVLRGIHYSDSDVLVAFRIVRKDLDDSVIVLWRLLKRYPKPVLARSE